MAMRASTDTHRRLFSTVPLIAALGGCCLSFSTGLVTAGSGVNGSSIAGGTAAAATSSGISASTSAGSSSGGTIGNTTGGSTGATGTTGGSSTGTPPLAPLLLMDAGPDTVFGPVALAQIPSPSSVGAARLAYSVGDGGQYDVLVQTFGGDGGEVGAPVSLAMTGMPEDGGLPALYYSPPAVAVSDDGSAMTACWEDIEFGRVLCSSTPETGGDPKPVFSSCGGLPELIFNISDGTTRLFFTACDDFLETWEVGQDAGATEQIFVSEAIGRGSAALANGNDGALFSLGAGSSSGLFLAHGHFGEGGYTTQPMSYAASNRFYPIPIAAAADPASGNIAVLELQDGALTEDVFLPAGAAVPAPAPTAIPAVQAPIGAIAASVCPGTFAYFATTAFDTVLFTQSALDGGMLPDRTRYLELGGFIQVPSDIRYANLFYHLAEPVTTMAAVPAPAGNLFLAISTPWQVGVYLVSCE
jgi:hypothetical protein